MSRTGDEAGGSPPCFAHELVGGQPVDPETARDVARFRTAERQRLKEARLAVPAAERAALAEEIAGALDGLAEVAGAGVVGVYWPFRGELDLRGWMARLDARGVRVALPVVATEFAPLVFRRWRPRCRMERGVWNIPVPADGEPLTPDLLISPLVGLDRAGYRLGNGGGYYDRTLAAASPRPTVIGVGHPVARIETIFPQPWDIPMDIALTGAG